MENITKEKQITKPALIWGIISGILLATIGFIGLFINPIQVAISTVWAFGFITLFTGVFGIISSFNLKARKVNVWWVLLIQGISGIILGIYLMTSPIITEIILIQFAGIYLIVFNIMRLIVTREDFAFVLLKIIIGVAMTINTGFFLVWGFVALFILFLVNGIYSAFMNAKLLKNS